MLQYCAEAVAQNVVRPQSLQHLWSAAEVQEESVVTRTVCENVSGPLGGSVSSGRMMMIRACPFLANRHGRERTRYVTGFQSRRLTVFSSIIGIALIVLAMSAPGQRHLTCAVRSSNRLSPMPPQPAEGVRAARHANTPGDRAEP